MKLPNNLLFTIKNQLVAKSMGVLALRIFGISLFFLSTLFITNFFDASLVGEYDFSRALLLFLGAVSLFGMHQAIIYYSGFLSAKENLGYIKKVYFKMVGIMFVFSVLILLISQLLQLKAISDLIPFPINETAIKTIFALFFYALTMLNIDVFRAIRKIYLSELYRNVIRYLPFLVAVLVIYFINDTELLVDVFLYNFVFIALISTVFLLFYFRKLSENNDSVVAISYKNILTKSAPMAVSGTAFLLMQSVDVLMLTHFTNYKTVAYYAVAVKLTLIINIVLASVNAVIAPQIAEFFSAEKIQQLKDTISKASRIIFFMTFPMIIILAIFSTFVLGLFGEAYKVANTAFLLLLIGQVVNTFCGSVGVYLNMTGKQKIFQIILISALAINILFNAILIPRLGMIGAAIATTTSMVLWNVIAVIYVYKKDKVKIFLTVK